jgi:hypothetical protein
MVESILFNSPARVVLKGRIERLSMELESRRLKIKKSGRYFECAGVWGL